MKLRKWLLFSAVLSLVLAVHTAFALELSAGPVTPFDENPVTVRSDTSGTLTLIPSLPDYDLKPVVTDYPLDAGETVIPWDGLSWHGEPLPSGRIMLNAQLQLIAVGNINGWFDGFLSVLCDMIYMVFLTVSVTGAGGLLRRAFDLR